MALPESMKKTGGKFEVKYTNPLSKMQMADEAMGVQNTVNALIPIAQFDPSVLKRVDWKEYADIMREANGAPSRLFKSDEQMDAEEAQEAELANMQMMVQSAPQVAGAIKDVAQAQSYTSQ